MKNVMKHNRKGFVLVLSLLNTAILLILMIPYISRVVADYRFTSKIYSSTAALDLAEAGIERALWEIRYNNMTFSGWTPTPVTGGTQYSLLVNSFQTSTGDSIGDYDVIAWISSDGMTATATSTGYVPKRLSPDEKRIVRVTYARHNFGKAIVGLNGITMSGNAYIDSYNSTLGPYSNQPHTQNGDIASNGAIILSGNGYVNGDANPGPDYPFSGTPPVSGSYGTLQVPLVVDPIPVSTIDAAKANNNNGNIIHDPNKNPLDGYALSVGTSDSITLPGGTYYFTSISITGEISVTGPSTIYVDGGSVNISGHGLINSGPPRNLLLYSTGSTINLSGQSVFAGAVYAPTATVKLTGQDNFYGSIICGSSFDSGNAAIHFDLDLLNVSPVFANNKVTSWQETKQ